MAHPASRAMRAVAYILVTLATLIGASTANAADAPHIAMRLVPKSVHPAAGGKLALAIDARPATGWHGYWKNPGDAGLELQAQWTLPPRVTAAPFAYPVPQRLLVAGLMNYVFEKPYALLTDLAIPAGLAPGTALPIRVKLDYLVCTHEVCVPETQTLATDLTIGDGAVDPAVAAEFDRWRRAIPKPIGSPATWQADGKRLRIAVPYPADAPLGTGTFFPGGSGMIDQAAPQTVTRDGERLVIETAAPASAPGGRIEGVLDTGAGPAFAIDAAPGTVSPAATGGGGDGGWIGAALVAFAGALAGGLILNVMPCVFPILSLKALSLARAGAEDERAARAEALAYTGGVVLVCLGLGAAILALRAGGSAVGWAFQLQDPRMIVVLLILSVAIALNLAGLFEVPMPRFATHGGGAGGGVAGAFATGALAAFVATPCTGPFMGAALGAALVLPWPAALAVFAGLGLGLALPFLLLGFIPALRRRLPRPGLWMERLRRILSVPMWLTAIALAWVLGRQVGVEAMTLALVAALLAALVLWIAGTRQRAGHGFGAVAAAALALVLVGTAMLVPRERVAAAAPLGTEPFTEARLAALQAEGRPVFAYFTADWCLTCKVNEKTAIETQAATDAFRNGKVAVLVGDWTDGDPTLGRFIERHNRAGVPLYLWYPAGGGAPRVMPQVLTAAMLADMAGGKGV